MDDIVDFTELFIKIYPVCNHTHKVDNPEGSDKLGAQFSLVLKTE